MVNYLQKGQTITGEHYAKQLQQLQEKIWETKPTTAKKIVLFHHDNAHAHTLATVIAKIMNFSLTC